MRIGRSSSAAMSCTFPSQQGRDGAEQYPGVERDRGVADVVLVEAKAVVEAGRMTPAHLPQSGQPGFCLESSGVPQLPGFRSERGGTRSDERHVTAQHVPELRQLVETGRAQQA